ncbi:UTP--glucose-1-phosphate uridylyltransferase [bacterium]|jgi:UTP--glucose-1-phosphate uridylyltransferase|nr:UTP--glucose-1-phosphate uridylyltransferase [bacterium]
MTKKSKFELKMIGEGLPSSSIKRFHKYLENMINPNTHKWAWDDLQPINKESLPQITDNQSTSPEALKKLAVIKLNGGLGTSMGCHGPKSAIIAKNNQSFLEIALNNHKALCAETGTAIPFILMNSYRTHKVTTARLRSYEASFPIHTFIQNQFPRIKTDTITPFEHLSDEETWNPPGHGDIYYALFETTLGQQLIDQGIETLFISNTDNVGATVSNDILANIEQTKASFVMEVTPKTLADKKGGTLVHFQDQLMLLERAQVPVEKIREFESIDRFSIFNTNNIWVNLPELNTLIKTNKLNLTVMQNPKTINGQQVTQLETAMGDAIHSFPNAQAVLVPRSRFIPVKTTADLLRLRSDYFIVNELKKIVPNPNRACFNTVLPITLSDDYTKIEDFETLIPTPPSLVDCTSLTMNKAHKVGANTVFTGDIVIEDNLE